MIHYLKGDATRPQGSGPRFIIHLVNDRGGWGGPASFVKAVSRRWVEPEMMYREWAEDKTDPLSERPFELGQVQYVAVEEELWVCNLLAQHGYATKGQVPLDYDALEKCLVDVAEEATTLGAAIHGPRIGTGLAKGQWWRIEQILTGTCSKHDVFIYDLP